MATSYFAQGNAHYREGALEKAVASYKKAIESQPDFYVYHYNLAKALHALGKTDEARVAVSRARELQRKGTTTWPGFLARPSAKPIKTNKAAALAGDASNWRDDLAVKAMLEWMPPFEQELKESYRASSLSKEPDTFVLYRIIGNDLYPRHAKGQSRQNVRFILENEPELADCEKRWVLNRIFDAGERQAIIELLEQHGQPYLEIPFEAEAFAQIGWDYSAFPEPGFLSSAAFHKLGPLQQERVLTAAYRKKNLYLMNNNGARNAALEDGIGRAKWVLPWDGNCFVTRSAWEAICSAVRAAPYLPYFAVPMQRITDNAELLLDDFIPSPVEEPQLLFRCDTRERFGEGHPYGRRPKVELFWRLGIPGNWDRWKDDPWEQKRAERSSDAGAWGVAGWVARLASGQAHLEAPSIESFKNRGRERQKSICAAINHVTRVVSAQPDPIGLTCYRFEAIEALRAEYQDQRESGPQVGLLQTLLQNASEAVDRQPESPVDKPEPGPSGDLQDYYHPAPYWWPNPDTKDGLPYVRRDGERVPGTHMFESESQRYDRTRLQRLFDDTTTLALAAFVTGDQRYSAHAVRWLERWFIDPATRMNPHLTYAQVRRGRNGSRGFQSGVIEMKDLYYALDAVRLLHHIGGLSSDHMKPLRAWFRDYLDWLLTSEQGKKEAQARNNHGVYYDLHVAAVAAFLDDQDTVYATLIRAEERIPLHINPDGVQHEEMTRTITAHYVCFTLQGWLNLMNLAVRFDGTFLSRFAEPDHPLRKAVEWLLMHKDMPWPHPQIDEFDYQRFLPIIKFATALNLSPADPVGAEVNVPVCFSPHDGVQVYWPLSITDAYAKGCFDLKLLHVVVMRFGIGIFDEVWLKHRFGLLSAITIPSLKQQLWKNNMHFLVQVDQLISNHWLDRITRLFKGLPFYIQKLELHADRVKGLREHCKEQIAASGYSYVLTTRIDDDDALSSYALNEIHATAEHAIYDGVQSCVIALRHTTRYVPERNFATCVVVEHPDAIGLSVLTGSRSKRNVYNGNHKKITNAYDHVFWLSAEQARSLYVIHRMSDSDYNKRVSDMLSKQPLHRFSRTDFQKFGIDEALLQSWIEVDNMSPTLGPSRTIEYISRIEQQVLLERKSEETTNGDKSNKIAELLKERKLLGESIVSALAMEENDEKNPPMSG